MILPNIGKNSLETPIIFPVCRRCLTYDGFKLVDKITLAGKSYLIGNIADTVVGGTQQAFALADAVTRQIRVGGCAHLLFEKTDKVKFGKMHFFQKGINGDCLLVMHL